MVCVGDKVQTVEGLTKPVAVSFLARYLSTCNYLPTFGFLSILPEQVKRIQFEVAEIFIKLLEIFSTCQTDLL